MGMGINANGNCLPPHPRVEGLQSDPLYPTIYASHELEQKHDQENPAHQPAPHPAPQPPGQLDLIDRRLGRMNLELMDAIYLCKLVLIVVDN